MKDANTVFLFSGQGSQYPGMGKELYDAYPECRRVMQTAEDTLGIKLWDIMQSGDKQALSRTVISQPAILSVSLMALEAAKARGIGAFAVAGHSLGEYAAMAACGMLSVEDAFKAIKYRSEAMEKAAEAAPGGMSAILGLDAGTVIRVCGDIEQRFGYVTAVNFNSPVQTVIAGAEDALIKAEEAMKENGARKTVRLAVSAAFHSKYMQPAADEFYENIKDFKFAAPDKKFYSNVYGKELTDFSDMAGYLARHICSPVRFTDELAAAKNDGAQIFIELGPDKVLTGLVKKTLSDVTALNIENTDGLEKACAALSGEGA